MSPPPCPATASARRRRLLLARRMFALAVPTLTATPAGTTPASVPAVSDSGACRAPGATVDDLTIRRVPTRLGGRWNSSPYFDDDVGYRQTTVRGAPGWITRAQIFWLVRPGLAASVTIDLPRWNTTDLRRLINSYLVSN